VDNLEQNENEIYIGIDGILSDISSLVDLIHIEQSRNIFKTENSDLSIELRQFDARHNVAPLWGVVQFF